MSEPTIVCPNCKSEIKLTDSLAAPILEATRREFAAQLAEKDKAISAAQDQLATGRRQIERDRATLESTVAERVEAQRKQVAEEERLRAKRELDLEIKAKDEALADVQAQLKAREDKLREAQAKETQLLRRERELATRASELELSVERRVNACLETIHTKARKDADEAAALKIKERDTQIQSMQHTIEELKRKAEQGSQQLQGEAQELILEEALRTRFPFDTIEPVGKGEFGGDVLQRVLNAGGQVCGTILWESKRTKAWSDNWLGKLKSDQRAAGADLALIVSHTTPKDIETFDLVDGVWVTAPKCAMAVAVALRESLILMASVKAAGEGQATKSTLMYEYLTGPRFRHRVEAIVERFQEMHSDLNRERTAMMRIWAKREKQIQSVLDNTSGLYGDLQGIAGRSMIEIAALEMPLLEAAENSEE